MARLGHNSHLFPYSRCDVALQLGPEVLVHALALDVHLFLHLAATIFEDCLFGVLEQVPLDGAHVLVWSQVLRELFFRHLLPFSQLFEFIR